MFVKGRSGNPKGFSAELRAAKAERAKNDPVVLSVVGAEPVKPVVVQKQVTITDIKLAAREYTATAFNTLRSALEAPDCPWSTKATAAQIMLDRGWGKAVQVVDAQVSVFDRMSETEQKALLAALVALNALEREKEPLTIEGEVSNENG